LRRHLPDLLFHEFNLRSTLENQDRAMSKAVEAYPAANLSQEPEDELVSHFVEQFKVETPVITEGAISVAAEEAEVDVSGDFDRNISDRDRPFYVAGMRISFHVPFTGDPNLLRCQPSTFSLNPPRADIVGQELRFSYERADTDVAATKGSFENELQRVRQHLGWVSGEVTMYNSSLVAKVRSRVQERRGKLERTKAGLESLGLPVRQEPPISTVASGRARPPRTVEQSRGDAEPSTYDVALSFAGEDRSYVERVAKALKASGVSVFYDGFETAVLWGKNLIDHLASIYQHRSRFVVMFISRHYVGKAFPTHERQHAQARGLYVKEEYILPARFDDTEVPGLPSTVAYADLRKLSSEELATLVLEKLGRKHP
jgi:TIR domain-containing protein